MTEVWKINYTLALIEIARMNERKKVMLERERDEKIKITRKYVQHQAYMIIST